MSCVVEPERGVHVFGFWTLWVIIDAPLAFRRITVIGRRILRRELHSGTLVTFAVVVTVPTSFRTVADAGTG